MFVSVKCTEIHPVQTMTCKRFEARYMSTSFDSGRTCSILEKEVPTITVLEYSTKIMSPRVQY